MQGFPLCGDRVLQEGQAASAARVVSAARIANIDRLRILAAIGIVWFHTEGAPFRHIAYAGLPLFLLIFCSLLVSRGRTETTTEFLKRRSNRLLVPWLFWCVVYGLCRMGKALCTADIGSIREMLSLETLLAGTSIHLWYLPYAFLAGVVIHVWNSRRPRVGSPLAVLAATAAGVAILAVHATSDWSHLQCPLPQWEFGLAAIPLGIAVGECLRIPSRDRRRLFLLMIPLIVAIEGQVLRCLGCEPSVLPHSIAVALICLAYGWEIRGDAVVTSLAPLAFGVYLMHPLVAYALQRLPRSNDHPAIMISLTVCISALATLVLMRTPLKRYVCETRPHAERREEEEKRMSTRRMDWRLAVVLLVASATFVAVVWTVRQYQRNTPPRQQAVATVDVSR